MVTRASMLILFLFSVFMRKNGFYILKSDIFYHEMKTKLTIIVLQNSILFFLQLGCSDKARTDSLPFVFHLFKWFLTIYCITYSEYWTAVANRLAGIDPFYPWPLCLRLRWTTLPFIILQATQRRHTISLDICITSKLPLAFIERPYQSLSPAIRNAMRVIVWYELPRRNNIDNM